MRARRFFAVQPSVIFWLLGLAMVVSPVLAEPTCSFPKGPPSISNVFVDFSRSVITIVGKNFPSSNCLRIVLGTAGLEGDISSLCTSDPKSSPQTIMCDFSAGGMPEAGDYRLIVSSTRFQYWADHYDVTIGAPGPQVARANQTCPQRQYVVGFDASGNIICKYLPGFSGAGPGGCEDTTLTFEMVSSEGKSFTGASWPGRQIRAFDYRYSGCEVYVSQPSGNVSKTGTLGDKWRIDSFNGYSNCVGEGGEDGDGVDTPDCRDLTASSGYVQDGRPSCSNSLCSFCTGVAYDLYWVRCYK